MAEHSTLSMTCWRLAFCTLRILPRIGSSAWNSDDRAIRALLWTKTPAASAKL
jgi:hypothetical protein